jgi:hypothetical protein
MAYRSSSRDLTNLHIETKYWPMRFDIAKAFSVVRSKWRRLTQQVTLSPSRFNSFKTGIYGNDFPYPVGITATQSSPDRRACKITFWSAFKRSTLNCWAYWPWSNHYTSDSLVQSE